MEFKDTKDGKYLSCVFAINKSVSATKKVLKTNIIKGDIVPKDYAVANTDEYFDPS